MQYAVKRLPARTRMVGRTWQQARGEVQHKLIAAVTEDGVCKGSAHLLPRRIRA